MSPASIDPQRGIAAVHLTLAHHYVCMGSDFLPPVCRADVEVRPDVVYLIRARGPWLIVKPGLVFRASEIDSAQDDESIYYPPADPSTVRRPAVIRAPGFSCPRATAAISEPAGKVINNGNSGPFMIRAPWLDITRLAVSPINRNTPCFAITLASAPRPDTRYSIGFVHELPGDIGTGGDFELDIDGLGAPHPLLGGHGTLSGTSPHRLLPRFGLEGNTLEFAATIPPQLSSGSGLHVTASTDSLQAHEPLLSDPLDAGDGAPDRGCLNYPRGGLTRAGVCSND